MGSWEDGEEEDGLGKGEEGSGRKQAPQTQTTGSALDAAESQSVSSKGQPTTSLSASLDRKSGWHPHHQWPQC